MTKEGEPRCPFTSKEAVRIAGLIERDGDLDPSGGTCKTCREDWKELRAGSSADERAIFAYHLGLRHVGRRHQPDFNPPPGPMLRHCPTCGAPPEHECITRNDARLGGIHKTRREGAVG